MSIESITSFIVGGLVHKNQFKIKRVKNIQKLFDNAIADAELFARTRKGTVKIERTETTLYINYLSVPNCNLIDKLYQINP